MRTRPIQMSFTNGEISPRLFGRSDMAKYWSSLETLENLVILPYGGVARRDGLHYVSAQRIETRKARLIPFTFSTEQAYIIEAGHEYFQFYMNHGQIQESADADTVLLLHMNGADGSTTFTDVSANAHTVTPEGTAQIDTDQSKFGGASGLFDEAGVADLVVTDHADFNFSADNVFTYETNIRATTHPFIPGAINGGTIFIHATDDDNFVRLNLYNDGHLEFVVNNTGSSQALNTPALAITAEAWHHIRVVGNGTNYYVFVDGTIRNQAAITEDMKDFTGNFIIGTGTGWFTGWMDEFRISNAARSTAAFEPPTREFPLTGTAYKITTPYLEEDLPGLKFYGIFDIMYIWHPNHAWRKLTRTAHNSWSLDVVDHTNGPWLEERTDVNFQSDKKVIGQTGATVTADGAWFTGPYDANSPHIGSILRLYISASWGYVKITAVADSTHCTATIVATLGDTATNSTKYQEGSWSGVRGYPSSGCVNEESLIAIANDNQPQTIWASQKGDYENFEIGAEADDAYIYTIPASNRILWPGLLRDLVLGTGDGAYGMSGGADDYVSPTNVRVKPGMAIGSMDLAPINVNNSILFWQKGGRKLRELTVDQTSYYADALVAPDLSLLADHITIGGIKYSAWQQEPNSILWTVRADGVLLSMTYMRPEEIVGWGRTITDGEIESVAVIPDPEDTFNEVWVSVKRTVDGNIHRYIEYMDPDMMVDSGITYSGAPVASVSGLDHLEGETVDIVADGVEYDQEIVGTGAVAIDPAASEIQIGLPYTSKLVTMKPIINSESGTTAGLPKKWAELWVSLHETSGLTINDEIIDFRPAGLALGEPIPLYTGNKRVSQLGWDDGRITLVHAQPLPITILGIFGTLEVGS